MAIKNILRRVSTNFHALFARAHWSTKAYLGLWSLVLRAMPDNGIKIRLVNSLRSVSWLPQTFQPRYVRLSHQIGVKLTPHLREFDFDALFYRQLPYEQAVFQLIADRARTYDAVIEVGANVGVFTLFFAKLFMVAGSNTRIYAFEPSPEAFFRLQENLRANAVTNVQLFNCALGDRVEFTQFYEPVGHLTNGSLDANFASIFAEQVQARPVLLIDGAMIAMLVPDARSLLIKIDVEGAENLVLHSLRAFIESRRPEIILEVLETTVEELNALHFLHEYYDFYHITGQGLVAQPVFRASHDRDYLLVPKQE